MQTLIPGKGKDSEYHRPNGHEFEQTPGGSEGQGSLVHCRSWGGKESDMTEQLNNNNPLFRIGPFTFDFTEVQFLIKKIYK